MAIINNLDEGSTIDLLSGMRIRIESIRDGKVAVSISIRGKSLSYTVDGEPTYSMRNFETAEPTRTELPKWLVEAFSDV